MTPNSILDSTMDSSVNSTVNSAGRWVWPSWPRRLLPLAALAILTFLIWQDVAQVGAGLLILSADQAASQGEMATALKQLDFAKFLAPTLPQAADREAVLLNRPGARLMEYAATHDDPDAAYAPALNNAAALGAATQDPSVTLALLTQADGAGAAVAEIQFNLGLAALAAGKEGQAVVALQRAAALRPQWVQPWLQLAPLTFQTGDLPQAELAASQALALGSQEYDTHHVLILALLGQEKWADGVAAVDAAQAQFPQEATLGLYKGILLREDGQTREALAALRQAFFMATDNDLRRRISDEIRFLMETP